MKKALADGKLQLGCGFGQLRSQDVARILADAGFQWAFIDTEHGGFDLETVQDICRISVLVGLCPIVRVAELQYSLVTRALDVGAQGIIFPRVESPELLAKAISWTKYPPLGVRGFGLTALQVDHEKVTIPQIIEHMNANTMVVLQIETKRARGGSRRAAGGAGNRCSDGGAGGSFGLARRGRRVPASADGGGDGEDSRQLRGARRGAGDADSLDPAGEVLARARHAIPGLQQRDRNAVRARLRTGARAELRLLYSKSSHLDRSLEWRNWQTHGTQNPKQQVLGGKPRKPVWYFPASATSGNPISRWNHYRTITRLLRVFVARHPLTKANRIPRNTEPKPE